RPAADEHDPYYTKYIERVPDGDLVAIFRDQLVDTSALLRSVPAERANFAYAPGKWSVKQVVGHVADTERVMAYRALRFARNDSTELAGFDENAFVRNGNFADRTLGGLVEELQVVRSATIHLAKHLDVESLERRGSANGSPVSVRALLYIIAGHERHHALLLRERYLQ
ncbi:MAG TPA: DinB family protein, partial [Gemmatimonadaceae bacterium]|nr:DinB family protein [Gemmatimonadaceae bacterium]